MSCCILGRWQCLETSRSVEPGSPRGAWSPVLGRLTGNSSGVKQRLKSQPCPQGRRQHRSSVRSFTLSLIRLFLCLHSFFSCSSHFLYEICCFCPLTFNCIFLLLSLRSIWGAWRKCMYLPQCWESFWVPYKGLVHPKIINPKVIHP